MRREIVLRSEWVSGLPRRLIRRLRLLGLAGALLAVSLSGCARSYFFEDISCVRGVRWQMLTDRRPPLVILAESTDGDLRARAIRALTEPLENGGSPEDQDMVMNLLASAARTEKHTVVRIAAVEKLGEFKDPRATKAIIEAFYAPSNFGDKNPVVRLAALKALGQHGDPSGVETLVEALERDPSMDVRMTAADALGRFQNYQATDALVHVLKEETDVALRYQANQSLQHITGKDLPPKAEEWEAFFQQANAGDRKVTQRSVLPFKLTAWFEK